MSDGTGERQGAREAMNDLIRRQREMGIPVKDAEKRAREVARKHDREQK